MSAVEDLLAKWQHRIETGRVEEIDAPLGAYELEVLKVIEYRLRTAIAEDRITLAGVWRAGLTSGIDYERRFQHWMRRAPDRTLTPGMIDPAPSEPPNPYHDTEPIMRVMENDDG